MSVSGASSHSIMVPEFRKKHLDRLNSTVLNPRHAAVLMLCYPKNGVAYLALILRPTYEGTHSGQVALPGGKVESFDIDYKAAALRETEEEIGVTLQSVTVLKPLTKVYVPPSNFWVHPFLGMTTTTPHFKLQEEEVAEIIEVPLAELLDDTYTTTQNISTSYASDIEVPCFKLKGYTVWGATAMMLSELKTLLNMSIVD